MLAPMSILAWSGIPYHNPMTASAALAFTIVPCVGLRSCTRTGNAPVAKTSFGINLRNYGQAVFIWYSVSKDTL